VVVMLMSMSMIIVLVIVMVNISICDDGVRASDGGVSGCDDDFNVLSGYNLLKFSYQSTAILFNKRLKIDL